MTAPDEPAKSVLSPRATLTIALAGIGATLIAAIAASWLTGHQQSNMQEKSLVVEGNRLAFETRRSEIAELRAVVDAAESALLRAAGVDTTDPLRVTRRDRSEAKLADIEAMRLPEARLTVRLGTDHPITRAYHLSRRALVAQLACDGVAPGDGARARLVEQAINEFNDYVVDVLGSGLVQRSRADDARLIGRRLNRMEKVLARPNFKCF